MTYTTPPQAPHDISAAEHASTAELLAAADDLEGLSEKPKSFGRLAWERFIHHKLALFGLFGLILIALAFFIGPSFSEFDAATPDVLNRRSGPTMDHWFGTDEIGRDLFVRTAEGGRYSLQIGLLTAVLSTVFGTVMGATAAYYGKAVDQLISQVMNLLLVVPALVVLAVFALKFGSTWWRLSLVLAALGWVRISRVVRGVVMSLKEQEFVMAARAAGASHARIIFRHILPNVVGVVAVEITLLLGATIVLESTLSFLGLGVKPPATSLGQLVADAKGSIDDDPIRVLTPGIMIVLIVLCVNFLGDGLRDALDPRSKVERG